MEPIRIVIAEDEYFIREGIAGILSSNEQLQVVGKAEGGEEAVKLVRELKPDVLLLDVRMPPGIDGIEVITRLRAAGETVKIIVLTQEPRVIKIVEQAGANGHIPKDKYAMLIPSVMCVASGSGNMFINPDISQEYKNLLERVEEAELTEQEMKVWRLLNFKNEEIARKMNRALGRVRNIIAELYFKLDISDQPDFTQRTRAVQMGKILGIIEEPEIKDL